MVELALRTRGASVMDYAARGQSGASVDRAQQEAFEQMLEGCLERLWRYAYRLARHTEDAEDLLAEALAEGYRAFRSYRGRSSFATWMYRIITTTWLDMRRKAARRPSESLEALMEAGRLTDLPTDDTTPETTLMDRAFSARVEEALQALPPEYRAVIILVDVEELDYRQAAEVLDVPVGTVRSRVHRGRQALRARLASPTASTDPSRGRTG